MTTPTRPIHFGPFTLDGHNRALLREGRRISLRPKTWAVLDHLVAHVGELVTKEALMAAVWPDVHVSDGVLKVCVRELRGALGDDPQAPTFVETRHRVGYRFVGTLRAAPPDADAGSERAPFVGRVDELHTLHGLIDAAAAGDAGPRVAFVAGEPGLGKSALVEELLVQARRRRPELRACTGACVEQHGVGEALFVFLEGLGALAASDRSVRDHLRAYAPTWCLHLPELFPGDDALADDALGASRARMLRELRAALADLPGDRPLVWVLEDVHWIDPSSADLLRYLGAACRRDRVLFVCTLRTSVPAVEPLDACRLELVAARRAVQLALPPLSTVEVARYLDLTLGPDVLDAEARERVAARTEGHPLFLASLVELLRGGRDPAELLGAVPASVEAMVERKLGALDPAGRHALSVAAVQGTEFRADVLADVLDAEPAAVEEQIGGLWRAHRVACPADGLRYRFAHALYRDALYASVPSTRRAALHRRVALSLEARARDGELEGLASTLAHHLELAGDYERALAHLGVLVETTERRLALAEADATCARALALVDRLPEARRAANACRFHERRAGVRLAAGRFAEATGDLEAMRRHARAAGQPAAEIAALMLTFRQLGYLTHVDEARAAAAEAAALAERHALPILGAEIDASVAALDGARGRLAAACTAMSDAFARLEQAGARPSLALQIDRLAYACMQGNGAALADALAVSCAEAARSGSALQVGVARFWSAAADAQAGRFTAAFAVLDQAIGLAERNEDVFVLPRLLALAATLRRELGDPEGASSWDRRALDRASAGPADARAHPLLGLALDEIGLGRPALAEAPLSEVVSLLERPFFDMWLVRVRLEGARARAALAAGDLDAAAAAATRHAALADQHDLGKHRVRAHLELAEVALRRGSLDACARELDALDARLAARPLPVVAWRVHALRARLLDATGDAPSAAAARGLGRRSVDAILGATPPELAARLVAVARAAGLDPA